MRRFTHQLLHLLFPSSFAGDNLRKGYPYQDVTFVPKAYPGDAIPWIAFGSTRENYERWIPEICGICCLKMVGDTFGITDNLSLYELTLKCLNKGGFKIKKDGSIEGIFHRPLVRLARELGLEGSVEKKLGVDRVIKHLENNRFAILSIDLRKATESFKGTHLILVHAYSREERRFIVHDCAYALGKEGCGILVSHDELAHISNERGMILWKQLPENA